MKNILITIFSLSIIFSCERDLSKINKALQSDFGAIEGFARESTTQNPISKATINISNSINISVITDSSGYYSVTNLIPGNYYVWGIKDGYRKDSLITKVESNKVCRADLFLSRMDTILTPQMYLISVDEGYPIHDTICEPQIRLNMKTERIFGCSNYKIKYVLHQENNNIQIGILGIYLDNGCYTALGPAIAEIFLNISSGYYELSFNQWGFLDEYKLSLTDSSIKLIEDISSYTTPEYKMFWRYPPKSFAYLCGTTLQTKWICGDFLDTLFSKVPLNSIVFSDSGEIGYPRTSQGHYYDMPAKYFKYDYESDFDSAGYILQSYSQNIISQYSGVGLTLINWKNIRYYSW